MIHLSWNCQRLGNPLTVQTLKEFIRSHNPTMVFLMETKQGTYRMNRLRSQFGYSKGFNVDPSGTAEGLSLRWRPNVKVQILLANKKIIDMYVTDGSLKEGSHISFMYGPSYGKEKAVYWSLVYDCMTA